MSLPFQEITIELLRDAMRLHKDCPGFLIDGFPREIQQGLQFEQEVSASMFNTLLLLVIYLSMHGSKLFYGVSKV